MANYLIETVNFKREDAFKNGSLLSLSESEIVSVSAPFRKWGSTVKVRVPWGNIKLWNFIASIETTGTDEPTNWQDNIFLNQEIRVEEDPTGHYWVLSAKCFYSFWNPPQPPQEPGIVLRVRTLAVLK